MIPPQIGINLEEKSPFKNLPLALFAYQAITFAFFLICTKLDIICGSSQLCKIDPFVRVGVRL